MQRAFPVKLTAADHSRSLSGFPVVVSAEELRPKPRLYRKPSFSGKGRKAQRTHVMFDLNDER